jgi:hypothetical protein
LWCHNTKVSDLSVLRGMPLKDLKCDFRPERDADILRSIKTLQKINDKSPTAFWMDAGALSFPPPDDAWLMQVAALPAKDQVAAVKAELIRRNPTFDGKLTPTIDKNGVVIALEFLTDNVTDISPVKALTGLRTLKCNGSVGKGQLADLTPLKGLQLTSLVCGDSKVADLTPLKDMKLTSLDFGGTQVSDLSPLKDMAATLTALWLFDTKVADLTPLKEMKLTRLDCNGTKISDLGPLKGMPLKSLNCDFNRARDAEILRSLKTLETINGKAVGEALK